jgi:hypothetical protein
MIEVVNIKCFECGLISNDVSDWLPEKLSDGKYYYYCPECQIKLWWLKKKCMDCTRFSSQCPFVEWKTVKETGNSPACSLFSEVA